MRTVTIAANKGGVGKSTAAILLAAAAMQRGLRAGIIDRDGDRHVSKEVARRPALHAIEVLDDIPTAGYDLLLLDTPPDTEGCIYALRDADMVLVIAIPHSQSAGDLAEFLEQVRILREDVNPALRVVGVLPNMFEKRPVAVHYMQVIAAAAASEGLETLDAIPRRIVIQEFRALTPGMIALVDGVLDRVLAYEELPDVGA